MESLALVPLEFADRSIEFADYATSRTVTGLEEVRGIEDVFSPSDTEAGLERFQRIYEGVTIYPQFKSYFGALNERLGLDVIALDLGIWSKRPARLVADFLLMRGPFDSENVASKLSELEYKTDSYEVPVYYWFKGEPSLDINHPLGTLGLALNQIALVDPWLLAARDFGIITKLIDVQFNKVPSLMESDSHRALAEAVGEGFIGGAFIPPGWIVDSWKTGLFNSNIPKPVERLDRYSEGPNRWGELSPHTLALLGYRVRGDVEETVVALYYPDPAAASNDVVELEKRWNSFYYDPRIFGETEETLATRSCAPFSTTVIQQSDASVLLGTCPVIRSEEYDPTVKGASLWVELLGSRELHVLVQDLEQLRHPAE
jgi:hypothetical protein